MPKATMQTPPKRMPASLGMLACHVTKPTILIAAKLIPAYTPGGPGVSCN